MAPDRAHANMRSDPRLLPVTSQRREVCPTGMQLCCSVGEMGQGRVRQRPCFSAGQPKPRPERCAPHLQCKSSHHLRWWCGETQSFQESQLTAQGPLGVGPFPGLRLGSCAVRRASQKGGAVGTHKQTGHSRCKGVEERMGSVMVSQMKALVPHLSWVAWPAGEESGLLAPTSLA